MPRFVKALGSRSYYSIITVDNIAKLVAGLHMTGRTHTIDPKADYANATFLLAFGINQVISHTQNTPNPIVKMRRLMKRGEMWVVDPRRSEAAKLATRHLQIRAATDAYLAAFLIRELLTEGADIDYLREHAVGVDALRKAVEPHTLELTARRTGLARGDMLDLVNSMQAARRIAVISGTGTRMGPHPTVTEWLILTLSVLTGSIDQVAGTALLSRGLAFAPPGAVPEAPGPPSRPDLKTWAGHYPCAALVDEIEAGNLKAVLSFGGNPAGAIAGGTRLKKALASLDVLAVHDVVPTQTTDLATHVLPGTSQFEDSALITGVTPEGRRFLQYSPALLGAEANHRPAWWYLDQLANRLGLSIAEEPASAAHTVEEVASAPEQRIIGDPVTFGTITDTLPGGRWDLAPTELVAAFARIKEPPELVLIPRRQPRHMNWTLSELAGPAGRLDQPDLLIHPEDAMKAGVEDGATVVAASAHGELTVRARVTSDIAPGAVSIPHGHRQVEINELTSSTVCLDPLSGMILQSGLPISVRPTKTPVRSRAIDPPMDEGQAC